jgi:DNA-directed RNA polymerase specialized sigma24 family protein
MSVLGDRLNELHRRLLDGSRTASLDLFREATEPIARYVLTKVGGVLAEQARDQAIDAIIGHIQNPAAFGPEKSSLWTYLCMVAERNAIDLVRQRALREGLLEKHRHEIELWQVDTNTGIEEVEWKKDAEKIIREHQAKLVQTDGERRVLDLMLEGERAVAVYAEALGLDPSAEVAIEVKRIKDRIMLRMRKLGDELE